MPLTTLARARGLYYGWWIVAACSAIIFVAGGPFFYGFSVLVDPLRNEFGWSAVTVAAAFSLRSEVSAFGAPLVGFLIDRLGPRLLMTIGISGVSLGFVLLSAIQDIPTFYLAIIFIAITTNLCTSQSGSVLVARWFDHRRSRALTLLTIGGGLSGVCVPLLAWAIAELGWRQALVVAAGVNFACCAPLLLLIRAAPVELPDRAPAPAGTGPTTVSRPTAVGFSQALRTRAFWFTALAYAAGSFGGTSVFSLLVPGLQGAGISADLAALTAAGLPLVSLGGRMGIGVMGDTYDKRWLLAASFGFQAAGLVLLALPMSELLLVVFVILYAIGYGGPIPLRTAIQAEHFGVAALGRIQGLLLFVSSIGGLIGPVVVGTLVDLTGGYRLGFFVAAVVVTAGAGLALAIPGRRRQAVTEE